MFYDNIVKLLKELSLGDASDVRRDDNSFSLELEGTQIVLRDEPPGLHLFAQIIELPEIEQEKICTKLLEANFLGQATRKASLGLTENGKYIVANSFYPTMRSYREFYEAIEDFVNVVRFWKKETLRP